MLFKPSQYNCIKTGEKVAIFNTFSGCLALLEKEEFSKIQHIDKYCSIDDDIRCWLKQGLIVESSKNESSLVNYCRCRDTFLKNKPIYRILTTSACNARCFYCYEQGRPIQTMSKETATKVAKFIVKCSSDAESLTLNWFGGEPLLNPEVITLITQKVTRDLQGKRIHSTIITNASLFSKELITLAKDVWNLSNIQISLDGLAKRHDKRKAYISSKYSFEKTIKIRKLLLTAGLNVSLRLNYDKKNFVDIKDLVYYIKEIFGNSTNLSCYAYPLFNTFTHDENVYLSEEDIPIYESEIKKVLAECRFYNPLKTLPRRTHSCFATDPYSYVINADGLLYKCTMDMSDTSQAIGNVEDGVKIGDSMIEWTMPTLPEQCNKCILLPICQGGCRAGRLLNINMNDCAIKKQSIEFTLENLLNTNMI